MFASGSYISMKGAKNESMLWRCVGYFLLTISALECEKYNYISYSFCMQYSGGAWEYFELCTIQVIWHLKYNWGQFINS